MKKGAIGTLIYSYRGESKPLYALFLDENDKYLEKKIYFDDFRVLNVRDDKDLPIIIEYMKQHKCVAV